MLAAVQSPYDGWERKAAVAMSRKPPPMPSARPPSLPKADMEKIETVFRERSAARSQNNPAKASLNSIFQKVNSEKKHNFVRSISPEAQQTHFSPPRQFSPTPTKSTAETETAASSVSSLLRHQGRSKSTARRPFSSAAHGSVAAITKLSATLYFAPTSAVRSPRLSELDVAHIVRVNSGGSVNDEKTLSGITGHECRVNDAHRSHEEEADELRRVCGVISSCGGDAVVLVHGSDLYAVALVCMAHLVLNKKMEVEAAEQYVNNKRKDFSCAGNYKRLLLELQNRAGKNDDRNKGCASQSAVLSVRQRLVNTLKSLAKNWLVIVMFVVVCAIVAKLIVTQKNTFIRK